MPMGVLPPRVCPHLKQLLCPTLTRVEIYVIQAMDQQGINTKQLNFDVWLYPVFKVIHIGYVNKRHTDEFSNKEY